MKASKGNKRDKLEKIERLINRTARCVYEDQSKKNIKRNLK